MKYRKILKASFLTRPNRFIAKVLLGDPEETVHVKNTGRCKELLVNGSTVILSESEHTNRKTKFDLIAVYKNTQGREILVNMDSQIPNAAAYEWIARSGLFTASAVVRREVRFGDSRFDLYVEDVDRKAFIEVKGVTLEQNGTALFPDAPTTRGAKHVKELILAKEKGFDAILLFVIQMKGVKTFRPNRETDPVLFQTLKEAEKRGVAILAYDCIVSEDEMKIDQPVPVMI